MKQSLIGLTLLAVLSGCHLHVARSAVNGVERGSATFTADSAVFVFRMPTKALWSWNDPDSSQTGTPQYSWSALGQISNYGFSGEGVGLGLLRPLQNNTKTGTLAELVRRAHTHAYLTPPPHLDGVGHELRNEPALSGFTRNGYVVLILRQSAMLRRLLATRPRTMQLMFRGPDEAYADTVVVKYQ